MNLIAFAKDDGAPSHSTETSRRTDVINQPTYQEGRP